MFADEYAERLNNAIKFVKSQITGTPEVGVVLGSGLGSYGQELAEPITIPYKNIPGMLDTTVPGHSGCLIFGKIGEVKVLCLSGRSHQYEGLHPHEIQFAIRLLGGCGCRLVILTNAAGTCDELLEVGDLAPMLDHLNFTHRGYTEEPLEIKDFYHLIQNGMYDKEAQQVIHDVAVESKLSTRGCNYTYNMGPTYEAHAEVWGQKKLGCTNFGMSTVAEVIAAKEIGVPILAMSFVTNKAAGITGKPLTHVEVAEAAKKGEEGMKKLVSTTIMRLQPKLKEIPPIVFKGDKGRKITRAEPSAFVTEAEVDAAAALFGETKIDAAIVLAGTHSVPVEAKVTVSVLDLPKFPALQHTRAQIKIGTLAGKNVAVVDGIYDYCGFDHYATYYLVNLFAKLGAKEYIQTFAAGSFGEQGVKYIKDVIPLFERPIVVPRAMPHQGMEGTAIVAPYHGPEFWTPAEGKAMTVIGATHATLGLTVGLEIAAALKMKVVGIIDGAFDAHLLEGTTIEQIVKATTAAAPEVAKLVEESLAKVENSGELKASFKAGAEKGIEWKDAPSHIVNKQECPDQVKAIADKLKDVTAAIVVECDKSAQFQALEKFFNSEVEIEGKKLHLATIEGKEVYVSLADRTLLRAYAQKKIHVIGLGCVVATPNKANEKHEVIPNTIKEGQVVCVIDHMNIVGISPLMGSNKFGTRFPDLAHIYQPVEGLENVVAFNVPSLNVATEAYVAAAGKMGCGAVNQFGAVNSTIVRHSEGKYTHIAMVVKCPMCAWTIDPSIIAKAF